MAVRRGGSGPGGGARAAGGCRSGRPRRVVGLCGLCGLPGRPGVVEQVSHPQPDRRREVGDRRAAAETVQQNGSPAAGPAGRAPGHRQGRGVVGVQRAGRHERLRSAGPDVGSGAVQRLAHGVQRAG
ncbi:hypothetical protein, partial [Mycobacterium simiae]|uniref:hypothetical protein n=1 Tax=Mycobacterium simiae TaxID=1784 RepID=UPI001CB6E139